MEELKDKNIWYLMLDPKTLELKGAIKRETLMEDLNFKAWQLNNFIFLGKLYKGCILVEDE